VGFSQVAVTLGIVLFFHPVDVDVYLVRNHINLTTAGLSLDPAKDTEASKLFVAMPLLLSSILGACFASMTYQGYESGMAGQDYTPDSLEGIGMWNLAFWLYCFLAHGIVVLIVDDPVDAFGAVSATSFMVYFLYRACYPKPGHSINLTQENLNILGYALGVMQMAYQLTDTRRNGGYVIMMVLVLDYFLGLGHTYDRQATIDTIANCRLFYVCAASLSLSLLYALSGGRSQALPRPRPLPWRDARTPFKGFHYTGKWFTR
jgi:exosortase/archaeosortase